MHDPPQLIGKSEALRRLWFRWFPVVHDSVYHYWLIRDLPIRNISAKNLMACKSNTCASGNCHTYLVHNHPESIAVGLLRRSAVGDPKSIRIE